MATTEAAIRNRMIDVIRELVPASLSDHRFREMPNEAGADPFQWAIDNPLAAFRAYQVRTSGGSDLPIASDPDVEEWIVTLTIVVAYPQDARAGDGQALSRDDVYEEDKFQIDKATGRLARANFSAPYPDAVWKESRIEERDRRAGVDFLVLTHTLFYLRTR